MALSRAAAAAARKAAKSRGLKGNRAEDGSLTRLEDVFGRREGKEMRDAGYHDKGPDTDQLNFYEELAEGMSDAKLIDAIGEASSELDKLTALGVQMQEKNWLGVDMAKYQKELSTAKQKLKAFEDELEVRREARSEQALADNDMNAMEFERYVDFEDV